MDKKGYLTWRNEEKLHHAKIAESILYHRGYNQETIDRVKFLVLKRELHTNVDTQLLEDVVCLVFIEFYLDEFAAKHDGEKVLEIISKAKKKMSDEALKEVGKLLLSEKTKFIYIKAANYKDIAHKTVSNNRVPADSWSQTHILADVLRR